MGNGHLRIGKLCILNPKEIVTLGGKEQTEFMALSVLVSVVSSCHVHNVFVKCDRVVIATSRVY